MSTESANCQRSCFFVGLLAYFFFCFVCLFVWDQKGRGSLFRAQEGQGSSVSTLRVACQTERSAILACPIVVPDKLFVNPAFRFYAGSLFWTHTRGENVRSSTGWYHRWPFLCLWRVFLSGPAGLVALEALLVWCEKELKV